MQKGQRSDLELMKGFPDRCTSLLMHSNGAFTWQPCACSLSFRAVSDPHTGRGKVHKNGQKKGFFKHKPERFPRLLQHAEKYMSSYPPCSNNSLPALVETKPPPPPNRAAPAIAFRSEIALTSRVMWTSPRHRNFPWV